MPVVTSSVVVPVDRATAFAVSQTTGDVRLRWDPFIRHQQFLGGAIAPGKGVHTFTKQHFGFGMESVYVSFDPPVVAGMKMVTGPWFFERFGGGWRFSPVADDPARTEAVWRYNFSCTPRWLAPLAERIGQRILQRDIDRRIAGFARGCADPVVLAAARAALWSWQAEL